jgi:ferredoxin
VTDRTHVRIAENIDKGMQTAPKANGELSKAFVAYLQIVYTREEAELVQHLSMSKFMTAEEVAAAAGRDVETVKETLYPLTRKAAIMGFGDVYRLPVVPALLNLHMFSPDIAPEDLEAAKLYQQFFIKEGFYKYYEGSEKGTPLTRVIPVEHAIHSETKRLSAEEAHAFIKDLETEHLAFVPCPCRTRTEKMGIRECKEKYPVATCIFIGMAAVHFSDLGLGRRISKEQAIDYVDEMVELGLVATTDNYTSGVPGIICLCCDCCCSQVRGRTRWDNPSAILPSNFVPRASDDCILCGTCVDRCFFGALSLDEDAGRSVVDPEKCLGCGVCTITCQQEALKLHRFERSTPFETAKDLYRTVAAENDRL